MRKSFFSVFLSLVLSSQFCGISFAQTPPEEVSQNDLDQLKTRVTEFQNASAAISQSQDLPDSPDAITNTASILSDSALVLDHMIETQNFKTNDFSYSEHLTLIRKAILSSWLELKSPASLAILTSGTAGYFIERATPVRADGINFFEKHPDQNVLNSIGDQMGLGYPEMVPFLVAAVITKNQKTMLTFDELAVGTVTNQAIVQPLKYTVNQERPNGLNDQGFPSGHSSQSIMMATVLAHQYGAKVGIPAFLGAIGIEWGRMAELNHDLPEITMGSAIGAFAGVSAYRSVEKEAVSLGEKKGISPSLFQALTGNARFKRLKLHCLPTVSSQSKGATCEITP